MTNLLHELWGASLAVRPPHLDRLRALGVSIDGMPDVPAYPFLPHPFGVARVEAIGGGLYQPLPGDGALHVITPVLEGDAIIDLVAWRSDSPDNWLLRTGNGWALGLDQGLNRWLWHQPAFVTSSGEKRHQVGQPAHLFSDPLDWLRGCGEGLAVLDWSAPEVRSLDVLGEVVCSTPALARLLEHALTRPVHMPRISVMEARRVA